MSEAQNAASAALAAAGTHAAGTVLAVDDTPDRLRLLESVLSQVGFRVLSAGNGREGLEVARVECPDLVVSDVAMPVMDGIELCRRMRADAALASTPVLLVSAIRSDRESVVEGLLAGADDYLEAPYDPVRLAALAARLVERGKYEKKLRESAERFRAFVDHFAEGIWRVELDRPCGVHLPVDEQVEHLLRHGRVADCNDVIAQMYGFSRAEEIAGLRLTEISPCLAADYRKLLGDFVRRGYSLTNAESEEKEAGGGARYYLNDLTGVVEAGALRAWWRTQRDITEHKRADQALREAEGRLRLSQKLEAVGQLAGGVAHDFNNLLTVILGYSELSLQRLKEGDPLRYNVEEVRRAGERAASLTRQLLAFSRKQVMQPVPVDLNALVADTSKMLRRLIGEDIELVTVLRNEAGTVFADPGQIEQVIMNLVVNARDAMPGGGKITVETANVELDQRYADARISVKTGRYVMLAVSDTGHGMDAETQNHIFEPFFTTKEQGKGTGLGLSTVYGIVKQSGGSIWVYSEPGRGTTFKVYLPRVEEPAPANPPAHAAVPGRGRETILLVEDEKLVRSLARTILEEHGYRVLEAANGEEALNACRRHEGAIHLLLTDVVMPLMSGRELAEHVTSLRPGVPVLYMSGYTDDAIVHHGVLDPGTEFFEKPFTPEALARKVREVLDGAGPGAK